MKEVGLQSGQLLSKVTLPTIIAMLALFGMSPHGYTLSPSGELRDASVFVWVSLAPLFWGGGWLYVLKRGVNGSTRFRTPA
ncbi:hypothetical protein [Methylomicrobium lacus]|uniref:hypothetical protein n=1 Tax=Methylomicrobium lacus TaxID=136992 RepID=UPI0004B54970|nr:hypothetical protein [Methylomicrobium lacus]